MISQVWILADKAAERYRLLSTGFRGVYTHTLSLPDPTMAKARSGLIAMAYAVAREFLDLERLLVQREIDVVARQGVTDAMRDMGLVSDGSERPTALGAHLSGCCDDLMRDVTTQLERDVTEMARQLRAFVLQVNMTARAGGLSHRAAIIRTRVAASGDLGFIFVDRAGRKWTSERFLRTLWRHHLVLAYIESYLLTAMEHGIDEVEVIHPDPLHRFYGQRISLAGDGTRYVDVRDEVFHPNTEATLRIVSKR